MAKSDISGTGPFVYMRYMAGTTHHRRCTGSTDMHVHSYRFSSGRCSSFFWVLLRHLAVLAMENSVPLKNPCPAFNLLVDLHVAWVALSQGRFFINVPAFLLSGLPLGGS